ncbi:MAG: hypothetical protein JWP35_4095 [Caulobacter sp.]|nr:hypothetical protein [Caulobacter sp.]
MPSTASLDEAAIRIHESRAGRMAVTVGGGLMCLLLAPWSLCLIWIAVGLALEGWGVLCTRGQFAGRPVGHVTRTAFAIYFSLVSANWLGLSVLLWVQGGTAAQVCAAVIVTAVATLSLLLAFQSAVAFLFAGAGPALVALAVVVAHSRLDTVALLPTAICLILLLLFGIGRAREIPSALAAERRLRVSEAQFRIITDTVSDVIARTGLDGKRLYLSASAQRMTGYTADELAELGLAVIIHPDDRERMAVAAFEIAREGGEVTMECRMVGKGGRLIWAETTMTRAAVNGADGPLELVTVSRDITARKTLEQELTRAKEKAEAASAAKSDFLANMSHELRTPLNAVVGFTRLLREASGLSPEHARFATLANDGACALLAVINNVLDYSRLESGAVDLVLSPFDPLELARSMAALLSLEAEGRSITLDVRGQDGPGWVNGDITLVRQVLLNLLGNALKFSEGGVVSVTVGQTPVDAGRVTLRIEVADTGIGMTQEQLGRVFGRFVQADGSVSRRFGGSGLGLAICQRVVQLMGGRIGAESAPDKGSTFWFELDLATAAAPLAAPVTTDRFESAERALRVLVADDVAVNRELVAALLSPFDIEVSMAIDGAEAVAMAGRQAFDVILMDVHMPVMDGLAAARAIRRLERPGSAHTPIIALSASVLPEQVASCLEAGMDDHVGKPIDAAKLLEAIARVTGPDARDAAPRQMRLPSAG